MPRRQRFKPSRKPKPAIEPSEQQAVASTPIQGPEHQEMTDGQRADANQADRRSESAEDRAPR